MTQPTDDHYATLDVPRDASREEITRAYRNEVKRVHPDHGGSAHEFYRLRIAYETLVDPVKRRNYDEGVSEEPDPWEDPSWSNSPPRERGSSTRHDGIADADDVIIDADVDDRADLPPPPPPPPPQPDTGRRWPPDLGFPSLTPPEPTVYITRTNRLAVWACVFSLVPIIFLQPVALALGIVAKTQIARSGGAQGGGKRATMAIVLSLLWIVLRVL